MNKYWTRIVVGALLCVLMIQGNGTPTAFADGPDDPEAQARAPQHQIHDLGTLGGDSSAATAVNVNDQVAGWSEVTTGSSDRHAFLWQGGRMRDLGTLGGANSEARGINRRGWVVGVSDTADGTRHAFLWRNGRMQDLGTLGGANSEANAVNDDGMVVGWSEMPSGPASAFKWEAGEMRVLGVLDCGSGATNEEAAANAVNRDGQIVGTQRCREVGGTTTDRGVLWQNRRVIALPITAKGNYATGINHQEQILINSHNPGRVQSAYVMADGPRGPLTELGSLNPPDSCAGYYTSASGINEAGLIVGYSQSVTKGGCENPGIHYGFLWRRGQMFGLGTLKGAPGSYSEAYAISNQSVIVGSSWDEVTGYGRAVMWRPR